MNTFQRMKDFVAGLPGVPNNLLIEPGPALPDVPGRYVVLTPYGGPGLELEGVMDGRSWQVRVVGKQNDYNDAETIADAIDVGILSVTTGNIGGVHVAGTQRVGGAPNALLKDDAERTHFICSYIVNTEMALAN